MHETATRVDRGSCLPDGYDRPAIDALKASEFSIADDDARANFALEIADCLSSEDPYLRDGVAYEALAAMMRRDELEPDKLRALRDRLYPVLYKQDPTGVAAPFAALVLSEVARTDRIDPWMDEAERDDMLTRACLYLSGVSDYRGFIDGEGWRHGVAHGADWMLQLALNPYFGVGQHNRMLLAVGDQVSPTDHPYTFGEPERLSRVVVAIAYVGRRDLEDWREWVFRWTYPDDADGWDNTYRSEAGMIHRHNARAFLSALLVALEQESFDGAAQLRAEVFNQLASIP